MDRLIVKYMVFNAQFNLIFERYSVFFLFMHYAGINFDPQPNPSPIWGETPF